MVVVQRDHPLQSLELIRLELASNKDRRLNRDRLLDAMRDVIVVDLVLGGLLLEDGLRSKPRLARWLLLARRSSFGSALDLHPLGSSFSCSLGGGGSFLLGVLGTLSSDDGRLLLRDDGGSEGIEESVRLAQKMGNTSILGRVDELEVPFLVVGPQRLETLLRDPLHAPLLVLLGVDVELLQRLAELEELGLMGLVRGVESRTMVDNLVEVVEMLLLGPALSLRLLLALELLRQPGVSERLLLGATEVGAIARESEGGGLVEASYYLLAEGALLGEEVERFEFDEGFELLGSEVGVGEGEGGGGRVEGDGRLLRDVGGEGFEFANALLDASFDETVALGGEGGRIESRRKEGRDEEGATGRSTLRVVEDVGGGDERVVRVNERLWILDLLHWRLLGE